MTLYDLRWPLKATNLFRNNQKIFSDVFHQKIKSKNYFQTLFIAKEFCPSHVLLTTSARWSKSSSTVTKIMSDLETTSVSPISFLTGMIGKKYFLFILKTFEFVFYKSSAKVKPICLAKPFRWKFSSWTDIPFCHIVFFYIFLLLTFF